MIGGEVFCFVNQLEYEWLEYPTTMFPDAVLERPYPSVAKAGCGLCAAVMLIEALTGRRISVEEAIDLSVQAGANCDGTDMKILSKRIAERFGLKAEFSDELRDLTACLDVGGCAILNTGKKNGLFSDGGHYIMAFRYENERIWIADPSFSEEKYMRQDRVNKVIVKSPFVLALLYDIEEQCGNREPAYYLFQGEEL